MIHISKITRRYSDSLAEIRAAKTAQLANELAEERISRELVQQHNERVRERRSTPYYLQS